MGALGSQEKKPEVFHTTETQCCVSRVLSGGAVWLFLTGPREQEWGRGLWEAMVIVWVEIGLKCKPIREAEP